MNRDPIRTFLLQVFSLLVVALLFLSLFLVHVGFLRTSYLLAVLSTLGTAIVLRYTLVYHRFSKPLYRILVLVPVSIAFVAAGANAIYTLYRDGSLRALGDILRREAALAGAIHLFSNWRFAIVLVLAALLIVLGTLRTRDVSSYPKPANIREIARSPAYFGFACTIFGLWAVLFVGISLQRVIVIAPVFEEILKFGIALLIGSVLFGRSLSARVGIAIVVGSVFGVVEHATTYPTEQDAIYLFRTLFHSATTVLSIGVYTTFEAKNESRVQWIAPVYSMIIHFLYNTFSVVSTVLSLAVFGSQIPTLPLVYGSAAFLLTTGLFLLVIASDRLALAVHEPLEHVLSDLV